MATASIRPPAGGIVPACIRLRRELDSPLEDEDETLVTFAASIDAYSKEKLPKGREIKKKEYKRIADSSTAASLNMSDLAVAATKLLDTSSEPLSHTIKPPQYSGELPFVPCAIPDCRHQATLWSSVERRPYCISCWNKAPNHIITDVKLKPSDHPETQQTSHHCSMLVPGEEEDTESPSIQPKVCTGLSLRKESLTLDKRLSLVSQRAPTVTKRMKATPVRERKITKKTTWRRPRDHVIPVKQMANPGSSGPMRVEPSMKPRDFATPVSDYSQLLVLPNFSGVESSNRIKTFGTNTVMLAPRHLRDDRRRRSRATNSR